VPLPVTPLDLLAGLGDGVELHADGSLDAPDANADGAEPATTTVAETGKLVRSGDSTVRRLIRTSVLRPAAPGDEAPPLEPDRAGVLPRTRERPGE
jgi:hypothetical protein